MPAQTRTSSNIILGLSSVMRVAPTSEPFCLLNSPAALVSPTNSCTASLKHLVNFVWTPPCPPALLPGYSSKSMPAWCTFETQIMSSFCWISLLPPLLPYKHLSMAQSALGFPLGIDGSEPIWMIRRWAPYTILFATPPRSTQRHWIWWIMTIRLHSTNCR